MIDYTQESQWHEAASVLPLLAPEEMKELADDISANGLLNPVILHEGKVLDGRNRAIACKMAGIDVKVDYWKKNGISPMSWVVSQNLKRRHLTKSQLAICAAKAEPVYAKEAKERQRTSTGGSRPQLMERIPQAGSGTSRTRAAKEFGVNDHYVQDAKKVMSESPELLSQIESGTLTIPAAIKTIHALTSSDSDEWYTPKKYIEAARLVLGTIDLDPASCDFANRTVKAEQIFTEQDDGLKQPWDGNVWLNPPYGEKGPKFVDKLIREHRSGNVNEAILLVNAHTDTKWFKPLFDYLVCFTDHRIKFDSTGEKSDSPTRGNAFVYFGKNPELFTSYFRHFGTVVHQWKTTP
jgi:phage N-6-adenine-methyltransferase